MARNTTYNRTDSGKFAKKTFDERYDQYVDEYNKMESELRSRGRTPWVDMLSKSEFKNHYEGASNQHIESTGKELKLDLKYIRDVVDSEKYKFTRAQAKGFQRVFQKQTATSEDWRGIRLTYEEIRSEEILDKRYAKRYKELVYDTLSSEYYAEKAKGLCGKDAAAEVARRWFGSP